jgi:hypothetical protein
MVIWRNWKWGKSSLGLALCAVTLTGCFLEPPSEPHFGGVDFAANHERNIRGAALMEKISACEANTVQTLVNSSAPPNEVALRVENICKAEHEAWIENDSSGELARHYAISALEQAPCNRSALTRYVELVRGGAPSAETGTPYHCGDL